MVILTQPQPDELILDPLAGVASFLVAADQYVQVISEDWSEKAADPAERQSPEIDEEIEEKQLLMGIEPNLTWQRLALMNCLLHHLDYFPALPVQWGNSLLSSKERPLPPAEVILSMLIFTQKQATPEDFLQYIYRNLKPGGRAAVIVPDSFCTASGSVQQIRKTLLDTCVVHTVLRLPIGIFYPHQIFAHVLFFKRGETAQEKTTQVWFYDARSQFPTFGQTLQITREHLIAFETAYGEDPLGQAPRQDEGKYGRFRCFSRQTLAQQHDKLAISWLSDNPISRLPPAKLRGVLNTTVQELEELSILLR
jgi:type I restriction enzyme M protein